MQRAAGIPHGDVAGHYVGGIKGAAIAEADTLTEGEGPFGGVFIGAPRFGQCRNHCATTQLEAEEGIGDLFASTESLAIALVIAVQADRFALG